MIDLNKSIELVKEWAYEAGKAQKDNYEKEDLQISTKSSDIDLVTEIDDLSEKIIIKGIKREYPDHDILSEESEFEKTDSDYLWIIDPLDGTTNYAQGLPIFAVSIALEFRGKIVLGVVYNPMLDEMFSAVKGKGTYLNGKEIKIGGKDELIKSVIATGFAYDRNTNENNNISNFSKILPKVRGIRRMGAAAYDLACVACGRLDGYWEFNLKSWDVAAGILIIKEAGGEVVDISGGKNVSIIAGNKKMIKLIEKEIKA
ncbi:inositol monophosphatase family protein [Senegalia massiliensis]|uniref:Inositol-1-monophosphatase n=1 Tax=Senegalia massiliensis TaxID=1720316 RepID=A0A845R4H2_9CLOT|nr:inositol monophosphatase family protein [Senegalia massiliensis]NBI07403.1 inositol monophosphatase [Senegalia massiliensis]